MALSDNSGFYLTGVSQEETGGGSPLNPSVSSCYRLPKNDLLDLFADDDDDYETISVRSTPRTLRRTKSKTVEVGNLPSAKNKVEPLPEENADLETELDDKEDKVPFDETGQSAYHRACTYFGAIRASSFHRKLAYATQIDMKHYGVGPKGAKALSIPMIINTKVTSLNLKGNDLSMEGLAYITKMMEENDTITELDLSDNNLRTFGAKLIAEMVRENTTLQKLMLSGNNFCDADAYILAKSFEENPEIKVLVLSNNGFGDGAGVHLRRLMLECLTLQELDLSWNSLRLKGALEVAMAVKETVGLQKLDLSWNGFSDAGAKELGETMKMSTIRVLDLTCNRIVAEGFLALIKMLRDNEYLLTLKLGQNPIPENAAIAGVDILMSIDRLTIQYISLAEQLYSKKFVNKLVELGKKHPQLQFVHGYTDSYGTRKLKPYSVVQEALGAMMKYCDEMKISLVDLFTRFDDDGSMNVTHKEFKQGLKEANINMTPMQLEELIDALDVDGDGEIDFSELVLGAKKYEALMKSNG